MNLSTVENFIIDVLNCGTCDVSMLDEVYSSLASDCCDQTEIIQNLITNNILNLNSLLYEVYHEVADKIITKALDIIDDEEDENIILTEQERSKVKDYLLYDIKNEPFCNYQDTHFDSDIDQTISWTDNVYTNAKDLISYVAETLDK